MDASVDDQAISWEIKCPRSGCGAEISVDRGNADPTLAIPPIRIGGIADSGEHKQVKAARKAVAAVIADAEHPD